MACAALKAVAICLLILSVGLATHASPDQQDGGGAGAPPRGYVEQMPRGTTVSGGRRLLVCPFYCTSGNDDDVSTATANQPNQSR
ncbi:hypothetical protein ACP70R_006852 [Stipagrostis hirtigluma subsp. patula]